MRMSKFSLIADRHSGFACFTRALQRQARYTCAWNDEQKCLSTERPAAPTSKFDAVHHCIGVFARCKSVRGRRYRPPFPTLRRAAPACPLAIPFDEPNTFQTKGRTVDGGLAHPDADPGGRGPRDDTRT